MQPAARQPWPRRTWICIHHHTHITGRQNHYCREEEEPGFPSCFLRPTTCEEESTLSLLMTPDRLSQQVVWWGSRWGIQMPRERKFCSLLRSSLDYQLLLLQLLRMLLLLWKFVIPNYDYSLLHLQQQSCCCWKVHRRSTGSSAIHVLWRPTD